MSSKFLYHFHKEYVDYLADNSEDLKVLYWLTLIEEYDFVNNQFGVGSLSEHLIYISNIVKSEKDIIPYNEYNDLENFVERWKKEKDPNLGDFDQYGLYDYYFND